VLKGEEKKSDYQKDDGKYKYRANNNKLTKSQYEKLPTPKNAA
jgi:hypothetical protein